MRTDARVESSTLGGGKKTTGHQREGYKDTCGRCGARRVDLQLGLEPTPQEYVARMVAVFREVRRVMRDDATCWLNIGDSYAAARSYQVVENKHIEVGNGMASTVPPGLKPKDLCGIPWTLAKALQDDGWCLRSEVIWAKPNPMPESVTDRPTKSHEQVFLLTKATWRGPVEPMSVTERDAAWLAALIDGEGTICFQERQRATLPPNVGIRLSIVNTNIDLLRRVEEICGAGGVGTPSPRLRGDGSEGRPVYTWQATNAKAARIIHAVRPHLIAKRQQADLALACHVLNQKRRGRGLARTTDAETQQKRRLSEACSSLNRGLAPDLSWFTPPPQGRWVPNPYSYDADAIREPDSGIASGNGFTGRQGGARDSLVAGGTGTESRFAPGSGRNKRSVWEIATQPYPDAHFATFPEKLVEPCILAGTSERGCCPDCGAPWVRVTERTSLDRNELPRDHPEWRPRRYDDGKAGDPQSPGPGQRFQVVESLGWLPSCEHGLPPVPCTILDPFLGSGTTAYVARRFGRRSIGIELSPAYATLAADRMRQQSLFAG